MNTATKNNPWNLTLHPERYSTENSREQLRHICDTVAHLSDTTPPQDALETLQDTLDELSDTTQHTADFTRALAAGDTTKARESLAALHTAQQIDQQAPYIRDLQKTLTIQDAETRINYITANLEKARQGFNAAGAEFSELWYRFYTGHPLAPDVFATNTQFKKHTTRIEELAHMISSGKRLLEFLQGVTGFNTPAHTDVLIAHRATPKYFTVGQSAGYFQRQETLIDPMKKTVTDTSLVNRSYNKGQLERVTQLFAATGAPLTPTAKPGEKLTYQWRTQAELEKESQQYKKLLESFGEQTITALDAYRYWEGAE